MGEDVRHGSGSHYLDGLEPINLKSLHAQALQMGDEVHNRNTAASALFLKKVLYFLIATDHFFLNLSICSCKVMLQTAHNVKNSSLVTVMARNGIEFGIRISGTGDQWFTASFSRDMRKITQGVNPALSIPSLNFAGTAAMIDIRKVLDCRILPIINTGIGITRPPMECFIRALKALHGILR